jgi:hypothetical protein
MQPSTTPTQVTDNATCTDCDGPLGGNRLRCPDCVKAAEQAIRESGGRTVRPSDIAGVRERLADS